MMTFTCAQIAGIVLYKQRVYCDEWGAAHDYDPIRESKQLGGSCGNAVDTNGCDMTLIYGMAHHLNDEWGGCEVKAAVVSSRLPRMGSGPMH